MKLHRFAWVYFLAFFIGMLALSWQLRQRLDFERKGLMGDGENLASYGFDLTTRLIDEADLVPAGIPRDGLPSLDYPHHLDAAGLDSLNREGRSAFLLPRDRVIGVAIAGHARAYPLSILNWHEVVNDTLAGRPVLVTWSPLCGSAAVYAREIGGEARDFGVGGLFFNSNTLIFDRTAGGDAGDAEATAAAGEPGDGEAAGAAGGAGRSSLWSQLTGRALAGPAAADSARLARLSFDLVRLDDWLARHPATLILAPDAAGMLRKYRRKPYTSYYGSDHLQYPARPLPEDDRLPLKTPVLAVWAGGGRALYPLPRLAELADAEGRWATSLAGVPLEITYTADPPTAVVRTSGEPVLSAQAFWFAYFSHEPDLATALLAP